MYIWNVFRRSFAPTGQQAGRRLVEEAWVFGPVGVKCTVNAS